MPHSQEDLLIYLDTNRDRFIDSEELMERFSLTRTALWRSIRLLRSAGYQVLSSQCGYRLDDACEVYTAASLQAGLRGKAADYRVDVRQALMSTNALLRKMAQRGAPDGTVLIANKQTAGYGRQQRVFFSPGGGVYLSLLLRPNYSPAELLALTPTVAVAVVDTVQTLTGRSASIKWVNDVYLDDRKVCGILTETAWRADGQIDYVVIGIGVNVLPPVGGFPMHLEPIATSLYPIGTSPQRHRSDFVVTLLNRLAELLSCPASPEIHASYCRSCFIPGRTVMVISANGEEQPAVALEIDDQYRLLVRYPSGKTEALMSGEISIKPLRY